MSLTDTAELRVARWLTGQSVTAPTGPLKLRLMTANGTDSSAGTEVAGGTYAPQAVSFTDAANDAIVRFEGIANPRTIVGAELWDQAGSPVRIAYGTFTGITVTDGVLEFAVGAITLTID